MHASLIVFVTVILFTTAQDAVEESAPPTEHCSPAESWAGVLKATDIEDCSNGDRCNLVKGTIKHLNITFTPKKDIKTLSAKVHGLIGGLSVPYPLPQDNACEESGLSCPLGTNEEYTYTAVLPVKHIYPQVSLLVKWELLDEQDNVVICHLIPVKIVKAHKS